MPDLIAHDETKVSPRPMVKYGDPGRDPHDFPAVMLSVARGHPQCDTRVVPRPPMRLPGTLNLERGQPIQDVVFHHYR
jgi:hypothetical protein